MKIKVQITNPQAAARLQWYCQQNGIEATIEKDVVTTEPTAKRYCTAGLRFNAAEPNGIPIENQVA